ncbi:MAG: 4Fe-4S binding protein [Epulopiscium sp.]|nr:4Fe-4S binding protein [Candidatus Epulonipiscium sp.]
MQTYLHSVTLRSEKCIGCTDCIKRCPTEAIRVRNGKAVIMNERCIDCGMCIRVCRHHAKKAITDPLRTIRQYKYKIALPSPTLYAQFKDIQDVNLILMLLKKVGFDSVYEVAKAATRVTEMSKPLFQTIDKRPIISSACPAIVRLIQIRFPSLIENLMPIMSPMEVGARISKYQAEALGYRSEEIGTFFISPCPAKATDVKKPLGIEESYVDGVISIRDLYLEMLCYLKETSTETIEQIQKSTFDGISWAMSGGEGGSLGLNKYIAVDGIENVIRVLEQVENGTLGEVDFIESLACIGGCLGGPLAVENSFIAKSRLKELNKTNLNEKRTINRLTDWDRLFSIQWSKTINSIPVLKLDEDMIKAMEKMEQLEEIYSHLPGIDCGSCGAPTCRALAEDIVRERAHIEDCIFMLRQRVIEMAEDMVQLSRKLSSPTVGHLK